MRITFLKFEHKTQELFVCTNRGLIGRKKENEQSFEFSAPAYDVASINVITLDQNTIYGREITGKLIAWDRKTLKLKKIVDLNQWLDPDCARMPNAAHGLHLYNGNLYVTMPSGHIGCFKAGTLKLQGISKIKSTSFIDCFNTENEDLHLASDFSGRLYSGHLEGELCEFTRMSNAVIHKIIYDAKFDRYWTTDDYYCCVNIFNANCPDQVKRLKLTHDDVEWIEFSPDSSQALAACFDRFVYLIANEPDPLVQAKLGPFPYQVIQSVWKGDSSAYILCESGEVLECDVHKNTFQSVYGGQDCLWDLKASPEAPHCIWAAFENGSIRRFSWSKADLSLEGEWHFGLGSLRRILPISNTQAYALSMEGALALVDTNHGVIWKTIQPGLLRDVALSRERIACCSETGDLKMLDAKDGKVLFHKHFPLPLFSLSFDPTGKSLLVSEKCVGDDPINHLHVLNSGDGEILRSLPLKGNVKSINFKNDDTLFINGNGHVRSQLLSWPDLATRTIYEELQLNTAECLVEVEGHVYTTTYGFQLNTYTIDGTIVDSAFPFEDYATSLIQMPDNSLVAGGRGGFISSFNLVDGIPEHAQTMWFLS